MESMDAQENIKPQNRKLGDYELVKRISDGAQAAVYEGCCLKDGETVAIKVFKDTGEDDSGDIRFRREADILRKISHRNVVRYRDSFAAAGDWEDRQNCLVMEYMQGETLKDRLKRFPKGLPWMETRDILEQTLAGLIHAAERHGVIHRDIKPSNIFILTDGQVRLFDFGIARVGGEETGTGGGCMGSFDYMAPDFAASDGDQDDGEGFRGDQVSDVFSLTVVFYEMLSGQLPWSKFGERPELEYLSRWRTEKPKAPSHAPVAFRVIRHLTGFVDKGLSPDRSVRFPGFAAMLEALRELRPRVLKHRNKDDYELIDGLDKGGFAEVYKARRVRDERIVAVKRLFTDRAPRRFLKEAEILRKYAHPNLVEYVDYFESDGTTGNKQLFLVMEYLEGMPGWSLRRRIQDSGGGLDLVEVLQLFRCYLEALQYLHENVNQIIHRDIKPGNLYAPIDNPAKAKILDLGAAKDMSGTETHGAAPGTWDYMAPEFVTDNARGSPQTDIYALGLSMYEALVGSPAFPRSNKTGQDAAAEFIARATGIEKVDVDFSQQIFQQYPVIEQILRKSIHRDARERFESAVQMRKAIMRVLKEMGKLGALDMEEFEKPVAVRHETAATRSATQATETGIAYEWQARVKKERGKRTVRKSMAVFCGILFAAGCLWMLGPRFRERITRKLPVPVRVASPVPAAIAQPPEVVVRPVAPVKIEKPVVESPKVLPARADKPAAPAEIPGPAPVEAPPARPVEAVKPVAPLEIVRPAPVVTTEKPEAVTAAAGSDRAAVLRDLLKDLRLLRIRNIVSTSFGAFLDDATARVDNARLIVSQPEYSSLLDDPEVKNEQQRLWLHIAGNAIGRYESTKDGQYIAVARGALWGAVPLYGSGRGAELCAVVLRQWSEQDKPVNFTRYLPVPLRGNLAPALDAAGVPVRSLYLETLFKTGDLPRSSAMLLPVALSARLHAPQGGAAQEEKMDLLLVPPAKTEIGTVATPFYMARIETTFGMMRCYRDAAKEDLARDARLERFFTGRLETQSIQKNSIPYMLRGVDDAFAFCNWLSCTFGFQPVYRKESEGKPWSVNPAADGFRIPTEQEWEYAARFGSDWYSVPGSLPWNARKVELDRDHSDELVWFYYKTGPRSARSDGKGRYPLGMVDLCGNMGELAMRNGKWENTWKDQPGVSVCGGNLKDRTGAKVMPWSREEYDTAENVGFRVILPVKTIELQ